MSRIPRLATSVFTSLLASLLLWTVAGAAPSTRTIDRMVERAMQEFDVPGMAVSVYYDGELYYSAGHGVLEHGKAAEVDDQTLFQIASVSKAFTAASIAVLVDDGKLGWDDPVIDFLPEFRMHDPWVTREFTIRDLLTHRSGLPLGAGDLLLFPQAETSRDEIIRAMRHLQPSSSFRSKYDYDNLMYIIAGEVVASVAGMSYEAFVERRLLQPLGMDDCSSTLARADADAAKATPHVLFDGDLQTTLSLESSLAAAAGGINCSARSMATWLTFIMNGGKTADGQQLLSEQQARELLTPVTLMPARAFLSEHAGTFLNAYALGWNVSTFYGQPMYSHSGGLWGMTSYVAILPEQKLAVFASNNQMSAAPFSVVSNVLDLFLQGVSKQSGKDWIEIVADYAGGRRNNAKEVVAKAEAERDADSKPSLPPDAYVGTYTDPWYGDIEVSLHDDGQLWFASGRSAPLSGPLEHFQYDTFIARWIDRKLNADAYVSFSLTPQGGVAGIRMKAVSPMTDFSFDFHDLDLKKQPGD